MSCECSDPDPEDDPASLSVELRRLRERLDTLELTLPAAYLDMAIQALAVHRGR